jgi:hypothetical protein
MNKLCEILKLDQLDVMEAMGYRTERMRRRESGGV